MIDSSVDCAPLCRPVRHSAHEIVENIRPLIPFLPTFLLWKLRRGAHFTLHFRMLQAMRAIVVALAVVAVDAQVVNVTVFTESQCKYCTSLFREQLWPFYNAHPGVMNLQVRQHFTQLNDGRSRQ